MMMSMTYEITVTRLIRIDNEIDDAEDRRRALVFPPNHSVRCAVPDCPESVVKIGSAYFITFGHCGFNSPANNALGYGTAAIAAGAIKRYSARGKRVTL